MLQDSKLVDINKAIHMFQDSKDGEIFDMDTKMLAYLLGFII